MTKKPSPGRSGALTGALVGAFCRPVVVSLFWLLAERRAETWLTVLVASCVLGLVVGWLAGWIGAASGSVARPMKGPMTGALVGGGLAFGSSVVTLVFLCVATEGNGPDDVVPYWAAMALTGAFPGISGGVAGNRARQRDVAIQSSFAGAELPRGKSEPPGDRTSDRLP